MIGVLFKNEGSYLVTYSRLKQMTDEDHAFDKMMKLDPLYSEFYIGSKYTLKDYLDKRKRTNLQRFDFCPYCGEEIDWHGLRKMANGGQ